jgi:hypothetical protein
MRTPQDEPSDTSNSQYSGEDTSQVQPIAPYTWDEVAVGEGNYSPLNAEDILYRRVTNKRGLSPREQVLRGAFLRRPPTQDGKLRDTNGLSVNIANGRPHDQMLQSEFETRSDCCAVCTLKIDDIRAIVVPGTDIPLDAILSSNTHANIKRMPPGGAGGLYPEIAEKLATELAKKARVFPRE